MAAHGNPIANAAPDPNGTVAAKGNGNAAVVTLTPTFKLVFTSVLGLTVLCLCLAVYVSLFGGQGNKAVDALNDKLLSVFTLGCGAIIGLLGGRTLN